MDKTMNKALGMALGYLGRCNKSIMEMDGYLSKKGFDSYVIKKVIEQLKDQNYLNDKIFAQNYLESRKRNKPKSLFAFRYELKNKGIDPAIIDQLLTGYEDLELALLAINPKLLIWQNLDAKSLKKKVFSHLRYRGFNFSVIQCIWQQILERNKNLN